MPGPRLLFRGLRRTRANIAQFSGGAGIFATKELAL